MQTVLIERGREEEAYQNYGLRAANGTTNLAIYRSLIRAYPERDRRRIVLDLINPVAIKANEFATAKDAGFFDIALNLPAASGAEPSTLVRAARDFQGKAPKFAASDALLALSGFLNGGGYDPRLAEAADAVKYLLAAARDIAEIEWASAALGKLVAQRCVALAGSRFRRK